MDVDLPDQNDESGDAEVVWLYDPGEDLDSLRCRPTELLELLADATRHAGLVDVRISGTVCGLRRRARMLAFDLVDQAPGASAPDAVVKCVVFADAMAAIDRDLKAAGVELREGMEIEAFGEVRWEFSWGVVRLVVSDLTVLEACSESQLARDRLLATLAEEGLLTAQAGRVVTGRPMRIGLLAGAGTAGDADVEAVLEAAGLEWRLVRRSAPMSGVHAAGAVAAGVRALDADGVDVIVIARGGGGRGELAWADSDAVCRAVAGCATPVWAAVGHATDATVLDAVANRSCPTPSAAAADLVERVRLWERHRHERTVLSEHSARLAEVRSSARTAYLVAAAVVVVALLLLLR
jgi:exodeoxyribonuclease VII large subunit